MNHTELDKYEKEIDQALEKGHYTSVENLADEIKKARLMAKNHSLKNQRINFRISQGDLERIKSKAMEEGVPYQTLISSVLHKYLSGRLVEKKEL